MKAILFVSEENEATQKCKRLETIVIFAVKSKFLRFLVQ